MPNIQELKQNLADLDNQIQAIQDHADSENREITTREENEVRVLYQDFRAVKAQIDEANGRPTGGPVERQPVFNGTHSTGRHKSSSQSMFDKSGDDGGFDSFGSFVKTVHDSVRGRSYDDRLGKLQAGMSEGVGSEGGFLVPARLAADMLGPIFEESQILSRMNRIPMDSKSLAVGGFDLTSHAGGALGGLTLNWSAEGSLLSDQTPTIAQINLDAHKGTLLTAVTNELLEDSPYASPQLTGIFQMAARFGLERSVLIGTGVGEPTGVLNSGALISVAKEVGQTAATISYQNLVDMISRLHPGLLSDAVWVLSPTVLPQLLTLKFLIENAGATDFVGGTQVPFLTDHAGVFRLLGLPCIFSDSLPVLGTEGDILLAAFGEDYLGMRRDMIIDLSPHAQFQYDKTLFRLKIRVDAQSRWNSALTPENGNTLSWCVSLATRA